jgi:hypothetical protein
MQHFPLKSQFLSLKNEPQKPQKKTFTSIQIYHMEVRFSFVGFHYHPQIHNVITKHKRKLIMDNSKITYQGHEGLELLNTCTCWTHLILLKLFIESIKLGNKNMGLTEFNDDVEMSQAWKKKEKSFKVTF